ncbi:hypothetical protein FJQ54_17310 [Sandaracinobacter neustonicus]|uniref:Na+-dependent transporter n=1 Tax=Sandaracinobacter neustonicus TaxID=1715348 RepID=A0A501XE64_9SPHN|nr:hypothetical protein [Sandaracinobacter neustonicus]TPE58796.1 hypothetical protein FJQ54_17310 [Sandaracinobacter neustonicus]
MSPMVLLKLALVGSIVLIVLSIGMGARWGAVVGFLRHPGMALKAMASMFLVMPLLALGLALALPLAPATLVTLLAMSVSPMPPVYPGKAGKLGGGQDYVLSLFVLASGVTLLAAPLMLALDEHLLSIGLPFDPAAVLKTLAITILMPLLLGLLLAEKAPALADRLSKPVALAGKLLLLVAVLVLLIVAWPAMRTAVGDFTLVAIGAMATGGTLAGHLLGGPKPGNRAALATATALRHPGIALPLALAADPADSQRIAGTVLLYLLTAALVTTLYGRIVKAGQTAPSA